MNPKASLIQEIKNFLQKNAMVDPNFERKEILKTNSKCFQLRLIKFNIFYVIGNILLSIFENVVFSLKYLWIATNKKI